MDRRCFLASVGVGGFAGLTGCQSVTDPTSGGESTPTTRVSRDTVVGTPETVGETVGPPDRRPLFRVGDEGFERRTDSGYDPLTVRGVNLGMAKPGAFPGQAAITREEYDRWLAAIGEIATVVRTYTIHPPGFYRALAAYNADADDRLYLVQGTWVPTADLLDAGDARNLSPTVDRELRRTVDVLHGETTLPDRPGHASGTYDADVSDATLGLLFGIEWPPEVVAATEAASDVTEHDGQYLRVDEGTPFEVWLAGRLDGAVAHEQSTYGTQRPAAFVDWVTTDPLSHPFEPFAGEDRVSVDPDALVATDAYSAGTFAAYHVYPYYPDLLNETPEYVEYVDHRGERNSYAGYLDDLVSSTSLPVLVAEFGVPSSRGIAHEHVHGRDQGRHTERRQGEILAAMFEDIRRVGAAGGIAFAWQNEWFKRTWNLDARSVAGRRPNWSNVETPEQRFGLLAFDPADPIGRRGIAEDWADAGTVRPDGTATAGGVEAVHIDHDLTGLGVRVDLSAPVTWSQSNVVVTVGLTGRSSTLPFGLDARATADFAVRLGGPDDSRLLVDSRYDAFAREFGEAAGLDVAAYRDGSAGFVPVREPISLGYTVPATSDRRPFEAVETGQLRYGVGDPASPDYDSLSDVTVTDDVIELRLPWVLLNVADPSGKRRIATAWSDGLDTTPFDALDVGVGTYVPDAQGTARPQSGRTNLTRAAPRTDGDRLGTAAYAYDPWDDPEYTERLRQSYDVLRQSRR